jgi:glycyl-tRNA synthetase beta chain
MANPTAKTPASATLLVELLTEELPPKALLRLAERFRDALAASLEGASLLPRPHPAAPRCLATPRRLVVLIGGVLDKAIDVNTETTGPPVSVGPDAAKGFARKCGVTVESLVKHQTAKGEVWLARYTVAGARLDEVLAQKVDEALKKLPIPKLMRWGDGEVQFARPVHGLVMMHGSRVVPGEVLGLNSGNQTLGHRFLSGGRITIKNADSYEQTLLKTGKVIADFAARRSEILNKIKYLCGNSRVPVAGDALYDEITALVEAPTVYEGTFGAEFLEVPQECLILSMQQHQKYVPVRDKATGKLLPRFLFVSNIETKQPREIIHGNERVLRARLSDAKFFYDQDRKTRLEARVPRLASVVYHNKLGTQLERVERIRRLAGTIASELKTDAKSAERAAFLCKADLLTDMVGEFPELQGTMGRYYALHDGEPKVVAEAIEQHYRPRFAGDVLPEGPTGCSVALAEKLSALAGLFGIQQAPSGDKDPFGLRRAALGIVRILVENKLPLNLDTLIANAFDGLPGQSAPVNLLVRSFIDERFTSYLKDCGYTTIEIDSVLSTKPQRLDLVPQQLKAVRSFLTLPEAESLAAANKRVANILKQAKAKGESFANVGRDELKEPAEKALFEALASASQKATPLFKQGDYTGYLKTFAVLKVPVDAFFDSIMVMADDSALRRNRLALLADLREQMNRVADISKLAT